MRVNANAIAGPSTQIPIHDTPQLARRFTANPKDRTRGPRSVLDAEIGRIIPVSPRNLGSWRSEAILPVRPFPWGFPPFPTSLLLGNNMEVSLPDSSPVAAPLDHLLDVTLVLYRRS